MSTSRRGTGISPTFSTSAKVAKGGGIYAGHYGISIFNWSATFSHPCESLVGLYELECDWLVVMCCCYHLKNKPLCEMLSP